MYSFMVKVEPRIYLIIGNGDNLVFEDKLPLWISLDE